MEFWFFFLFFPHQHIKDNQIPSLSFIHWIDLVSFFWKSRSPVEDHHSGKSGRKTRQERKQVIDSTSGIHNAVFLSFSTERNKPKLNPASETPQPDNGPEEAEDTESDVDADMH